MQNVRPWHQKLESACQHKGDPVVCSIIFLWVLMRLLLELFFGIPMYVCGIQVSSKTRLAYWRPEVCQVLHDHMSQESSVPGSFLRLCLSFRCVVFS